MNNYSVTFYTPDERPVAWDEPSLGPGSCPDGRGRGDAGDVLLGSGGRPALIRPALAALYPDATSTLVLSEPADFDPGTLPRHPPLDVGGPTPPARLARPGRPPRLRAAAVTAAAGPQSGRRRREVGGAGTRLQYSTLGRRWRAVKSTGVTRSPGSGPPAGAARRRTGRRNVRRLAIVLGVGLVAAVVLILVLLR